ncbi:dihydrolipoamide acetyltransferase family protein [Sphingopyxis yananensis]|uniref:dihydrolipoamide acetyltransferase family protein n=1 Tax=Sphingopyxis yananensis TaxID=2886687 RepID=UPI001D121D19|nr:dihydrolipoamide acetyltransferase family protein [Sphingopyxis yananensis]MCC2603103.1 2-oxo acid dehydrogenase subunit E2 [Sphingopyxis yananensis]
MAHHIFKLPDIGEGTAEAELVAWHVTIGDLVEEDQPVADVMTDKATVELTAPVSGRILALHGTLGEPSQVGSPLIEFETEATAETEISQPVAASAGLPTRDATDEGATTIAAIPVAISHQEKSNPVDPAATRPKTTPAVRARAAKAGVNLADIRGSGPQGRIRQADLDAYLNGESRKVGQPSPAALPPSATTASSTLDYREVKLTGLRRKIAEKMEISSRTIPHFAYIEEVDVTELEDVRLSLNTRYNGSRPKLTFLPFLIRAMAQILPRYEQINATYNDESGIVRYHAPLHVGIATQTDNGLIVPVLKNAEKLSIWDMAEEISRLASATRNGQARKEELGGSSITITSLGTLGGLATTPVINAPEVAIIGPNRIVERPIARAGSVELRKMMNISSSFDHRVVDGYDAAQFIQELRSLLENPLALLAG